MPDNSTGTWDLIVSPWHLTRLAGALGTRLTWPPADTQAAAGPA